MHTYRRKMVSPTPSSIYKMEPEDDNDYLLDPDQMYDTLPQPNRMINKIITQIIDSVLDTVKTKENSLLAEARKIQPPQFDKAEKLKLYSHATALESSTDGRYIFVGLPNGLAVLDSSTHSSICAWEYKMIEITSIKSYPIGPDYYVVMIQDDMEQIRLLLFGLDTLFFIKAINENSPEIASKTLCQKWEASANGEYAGFVFEETTSKEIWFEAHKLPVENWNIDLNDLKAAMETAKNLEELKEELDENAQNKTSNNETLSGQKTPGIRQTRNVYLELSEKLGIRFSNPVCVLKVRPPPRLPLPASSATKIALAYQKADAEEPLGMGLNHVLSQAYLDSTSIMFRHRYEDIIQYLPMGIDEVTVSRTATFHFVTASRLMKLNLDGDVSNPAPVAVAIWWSGSPHLCHYALLKPAKESEETSSVDLEQKPEVVWPFTSNISCSACSSCTSHIAIGLENGNVVLWNRQLGLDKAVLNASHRSPVRSIRFLDPFLYPLEKHGYPPYPTKSGTFLLAECSDGTQKLYSTLEGSKQIPRCIAEKPEEDDDFQILLQVIPNLPELMIYVKKNGSMCIKDIRTGADVCQIVLPPTHQIQTPWSPLFAFGDGGRYLFLKGEGKEVDDDGVVKDISAIFMFDLCSCSILDTYRARSYEKGYLNVYITQEQRMNALMKNRLQSQRERQKRIQKRWGLLKLETEVIQQATKIPTNIRKLSINLHTF